MRDDSLPIMRIFTALFFIETDYVTALLNPYFLDFERGWILCIAALWNTFKPACTAAKHRSVAFCRLLGFQLLPRLKAIHSQKLYRPETGKADAYADLQLILTRPI